MTISEEIREYVVSDNENRFSVKYFIKDDYWLVYKIQDNNIITWLDVSEELLSKIKDTIKHHINTY